MTTQKAQRKIKSSTVAITVLSILLAIAVVSTIVLAAFTANKNASTTIQFGGGLALTLSSEGNADFEVDATDNGAGSASLVLNPVDSKTFSGAITIPAVKAAPSMEAFVGYKLTFSVGDSSSLGTALAGTWSGSGTTYTFKAANNTRATWADSLTITVTFAEDTITSSSNGVFYYSANENKLATTGANLFESIVISSTNYDSAASKYVGVTATIKAETSDGTLSNVQTFD